MWKPGSAKPVGASPKIQNNNAKSPSGGSPAKKLSTSTMGMRFMQRKSKGTSDKAVIQNAVAARNGTNRNHTTNRSPVDRKRDNGDISKDEQSTSPNTTSNDGGLIILELASVVDMYGVGSDIIGRRSFGGFHKSVKNTYDAALKRRVDDEARTNNTKAHITDEELLARYEKYVKGGGKSGGSGNRGRKEKRKRG